MTRKLEIFAQQMSNVEMFNTWVPLKKIVDIYWDTRCLHIY